MYSSLLHQEKLYNAPFYNFFDQHLVYANRYIIYQLLYVHVLYDTKSFIFSREPAGASPTTFPRAVGLVLGPGRRHELHAVPPQ